MRGSTRRIKQDTHNEESAFVSMTDLTIGFLFIVMLLLAFFASQYSDTKTVPRFEYDAAIAKLDRAEQESKALKLEIADLQKKIAILTETVAIKDRRISDLERQLQDALERLKSLDRKDPIEAYNTSAMADRQAIISRLAAAVKEDILQNDIEGLDVSAQGDALRFQGSGLFASGQARLSGNSLKIIGLLGRHLEKELPCFSTGKRSAITAQCNPDLVLIETIQVEGHTDTDGAHNENLRLSTLRAMSAFDMMAPDINADDDPPMLQFQNLLEQPILAVAGYGETRPIAPNDTSEGKAANRRIDLRFIMYGPPRKELIPRTVEDIDGISRQLRSEAAP